MAVVPTYERQVKAAPAPGPYQTANGATPDAFGAGVARAQGEAAKGVGQLAENLYDYAVKEELNNNNIEARQRDTAYATAASAILNGDPETGSIGYYQLQGDEAVKQRQEYQNRLAKARTDAMEGSSNDKVRTSLALSIANRDIGYNANTSRHFQAEKIKMQIGDEDNRMAQNAIDASNTHTMDELDPFLKIMNGSSYTQSQLTGNTSELGMAADLVKHQTVFIKAATQGRIARGELEEAENVLTAYGSQIDPAIYKELSNSLKAGLETKAGLALQAQAANQPGGQGTSPAAFQVRIEYLTAAALKGERGAGKALTAETSAIHRMNALDTMVEKAQLGVAKTAGEEKVDALFKGQPDSADRDQKVLAKIREMPSGKEKDAMLKAYKDRAGLDRASRTEVHSLERQIAGDELKKQQLALAEKTRLDKAAHEKSHRAAFDAIGKGGSVEAWKRTNPDDWNRLTEADRTALEKSEVKAQLGHNNTENATNRAKFDQWLRVGTEQLRATPPNVVSDLATQLTKDQFDAVYKKITDAKDLKNDELGPNSAASQFDLWADDHGMKGATYNQERASIKILYNSAIRSATEAKKGFPLNQEEVSKVLRETFEPVLLRRIGFGDGMVDANTEWKNMGQIYDSIAEDPAELARIEKIVAGRTHRLPRRHEVVQEYMADNPAYKPMWDRFTDVLGIN